MASRISVEVALEKPRPPRRVKSALLTVDIRPRKWGELKLHGGQSVVGDSANPR